MAGHPLLAVDRIGTDDADAYLRGIGEVSVVHRGSPIARRYPGQVLHIGAAGGTIKLAMPQPPFRLLRAAIFAAVCVSLTLLAHVTAAREPVPPWAVAAGCVAVFGVVAVLAGHERSLATIFGGLGGGQFALHVWFAAVQPSAIEQVGHGHTAVVSVPAASAGAVPSGLGMTLAHVAAAAVSAWWLWRGERAAWWLARWIVALATRPLRPALKLLTAAPAAVPPARIRPHAESAARPPCAVLRYTVVLRGPPSRSQVFSGASTA
jgi:hypothetical protein